MRNPEHLNKEGSFYLLTDQPEDSSLTSVLPEEVAPVILSPLVGTQLFPHKVFSHILVHHWCFSPEPMGSELQLPQFSLVR